MGSNIVVRNLTKEYEVVKREKGIKKWIISTKEKVKAVNGLDFVIEEGEIVGFIGPNGAGKSTTIKMLTGILTPTEGEVIIGGENPWKCKRQFYQNIGVIFGQRSQLWWDLPVEDTFCLLKKVYHISEIEYRKNMQLFRDLLNMDELLQKPVRQMSLGQRIRCEIAAALIHNPSVIFLDEPTIGLDVVAKDNIRKFIKQYNEEKKATIILTTHDMDDIDCLAKRIIIIDKGYKVYDGDKDKIKDLNGRKRFLQIELNQEFHIDYPGVTLISDEGLKKKVSFDLEEVSMKKFLQYVMDNVEIQDMEVISTPIEEIIKSIYLQL